MILPYKKEAYKLMHEGAIALSEVEHNGIKMDTDYLDKTIRKTSKRIIQLNKEISNDKVMQEWRKMFGRKTNINSSDQLGKVLFDRLKYIPPSLTGTGRYKVDEKALSTLDLPFVKDYLEIKKLEKVLSTYLKGIKNEIVGEYLHPSFNLHIAQTYRSSSAEPNFQNIPVRNKEISKLVRTAFIAREGRRLVEVDYSGIEVRIAACYHKDPKMIEYICDKTKDMHRDMAQECFLLSYEEMNDPKDTAWITKSEDSKRIKDIRYCGKNMFVFPQFYGDWYIDCARNLWNAIDQMGLMTRDNVPLKEHLKQQGITELGDLIPGERPRKGTFEKHIQEVENAFWNDRFPIYANWKKKWISSYHKKGYFLSNTGFICQGYMKRNEIINYPVQGSAFHCLLQSLIWLQKELKKRKMKTLIVGQIHDSMVADVVDEELEEYLHLAEEVMTKKLVKEWKWINVPLEIEAEVSPLNGCWADKKERDI